MSAVRRVFLITASSGIGASTARLVAGDEASIYIVSLDGTSGEAHVRELCGKRAEAEFHEADLTDPAAAPAVVRACVKRFDRIDALFNVAGISGRSHGDGPVHQCTEQAWATILDANATTQYRVCRDVVQQMLTQAPDAAGLRGTILNMSSILALQPEASHFRNVAYAASKGAVISMTRAMAACYARERIRVNAIAPGLTRTPMSAHATEDPAIVAYVQRRQPLLSGVIAAEDVASVCAHLLCDASRAMTGQIVRVDAGWSVA